MNKWQYVRYSDINIISYLEIYNYILELPQCKDNDNLIFILSQKHILNQAYL